MKSLFAILFTVCLSPIVGHAAVIGFTFNAGPVVFVESGPVDPEVAAFQGFQLGESVMVSFSIDDATVDLDATDQRAEFEDPNGLITLTGDVSGTTIQMRQGVNIQLDSVSEFDLRNILVGPELHVFELFDDIDYLAASPILSDPDNLANSISELESLLDSNGRFLTPSLSGSSTGAVRTLDSDGQFVALAFGPVTAVPVPAAFWLMLSGLVVLVKGRTRRAIPVCRPPALSRR